MIRPFTCACLLLAAGSGLWLYHVKHKAQVLDRQIERTIRAADAARERTTMLRADWALLNDPQRLQALAASYLQLQPITPAQFVPLVAARQPAAAGAAAAGPRHRARRDRRARGARGGGGPGDRRTRRRRGRTMPRRHPTARLGGVRSAPRRPQKPMKVAEVRPPAPTRPAPRPAAHAPIRPRPPVYTAFATQRTARRRDPAPRLTRWPSWRRSRWRAPIPARCSAPPRRSIWRRRCP